MSLYRMLRFTAVVAVLRRFRVRLARMLFAVSFALVSSWLYDDIASYMAAHHPDWAGPTLIVKTAIVYLAWLVCFWEFSRMLRGDDASPPPRPPSRRDARDTPPPAGPTPLDRLVDKPRLRSRRDDILGD